MAAVRAHDDEVRALVPGDVAQRVRRRQRGDGGGQRARRDLVADGADRVVHAPPLRPVPVGRRHGGLRIRRDEQQPGAGRLGEHLRHGGGAATALEAVAPGEDRVEHAPERTPGRDGPHR